MVATFTSVEQKHYASAGAVAEEVLSAIRTVVAFGGEINESKRLACVSFLSAMSGTHTLGNPSSSLTMSLSLTLTSWKSIKLM